MSELPLSAETRTLVEAADAAIARSRDILAQSRRMMARLHRDSFLRLYPAGPNAVGPPLPNVKTQDR